MEKNSNCTEVGTLESTKSSIQKQKWGLYNSFPRIMGNPYRNFVAYDINDINNYIKKYRRCEGGIHISVYSYFSVNNNYEEDEESACVDKVFLDIDYEKWLEKIVKLDDWLEEYDIVRTYFMSGKGNQTLIGCNSNLNNKKNAIGNFQSFLNDKFDLHLDPSNIGDLARSFRIPNIFNNKRGCYCIPLTREMICTKTLEEIYKIAEQPNGEPIVYGHKLIDLTDFDTESSFNRINIKQKINEVTFLTIEQIKKMEIPTEKFPPCVKSWINAGRLSYKGRYFLLLYLRDQQLRRNDGSKVVLSKNAIISILKYCLDDETYRHAFTSEKIEGHNVGENMVPILKTLEKMGYNVQSCDKLRKLNLCPKDCGRTHPIYDKKS